MARAPSPRPWVSALRASWLAAVTLACSACASHGNLLHLEASSGPEPEGSVWRRALPDAAGSTPALAVGATTGELIAARLDRDRSEERPWRISLQVSQGPVLAPGLVMLRSGRHLVALASDSGRRLWRAPAHDSVLLAATAGPDWAAALLADRQGARKIFVYDRQGREHVELEAEGGLGTPALLGSTLLAPSGKGDVFAVDVAAASEIGSARLGAGPLHALRTSGGWFFGGPPWVALTPAHAPPYALPRRPLPGRVQIGPEPPATLREDVTRLYVRPTRDPDTGHDDMYMATYGRIAFGLERQQGALAWVVALPGRALAARAVDGGFAVCDESGGVRVLAQRTGHVERQWSLVRQRRMGLGEPVLTGCALDGERVLGVDAGAAGSPAAAAPPLLEQLARVLGSSDPDLTEAQRFLSRELAARPEPDATRLLIELVTRHTLDRRLEAEAEDLLATRRNGQSYMLAALSQSGEAAPPPPIAPLGEALAALGERAAAPLLARQLNRPAHTAAAVARAAAALQQLATEAEYGELSVFFSLHRTTADSADAVAAVISVGRTLLRIGGQRARTLVQFATRDPMTIGEIRSALERELATTGDSATGL